MIEVLKESLWKQFGASIDMLKNAIELWPEDYWNSQLRFFYLSYHTLVFLDYYLTKPPEDFNSSLPFTIIGPAEMAPDAVDDIKPDKIYTKEELLDYLQSCRRKCRHIIENLTEQNVHERWIEKQSRRNYSTLEILLYNMRHVQHHAAQLNLMLRERTNLAPNWVSRAVDDDHNYF
jgi:hypothetical protein